MNIPQGPWYIDDTLTFTVVTHDFATGALTDADAVPAYRVYEDETGTAILNGNMAKLDDANTTGFYSEQITLSAANGFEVGKSYSIYASAAVDSVTGGTAGGFKVIAATYPANVTQFGGSNGTFSGGRPEVNTTHAAGTAWGSGAITAASIASDAITAAKIADGAIDAGTFAAGAIDATAIADNAIDAGAIASNAITDAKIATGAITAAKFASGAIDAAAISADAGAEIADAILNRDMSTGTDSGSATVRTVRQALRFLRNKWAISGTTLTVYKENDTDASWTSEVTATNGADPITANDPADA